MKKIGSGHKKTFYSVSGPMTVDNKEDTMLLTKEGTYTIAVETEDFAGNISDKRTYSITISKFDENGYAKDKVKIYEEDGSYWVPEDFKLAEDSAEKIIDGIVIEDKSENQYVWIACTTDGTNGSVKFDRYDFLNMGNQGIDSSTNSLKINWISPYTAKVEGSIVEAISNDEEQSIAKYRGFYIGRYETGDNYVTTLSTPRLRNSSDSASNKAVIKKGQAPYNYLGHEQITTLCNKMSTQEGYKEVKTKLTSSYAWDTALKFIISNPKYTNYATSQNMGNYNSNSFSYKDIGGTTRSKSSGSSVLIPTGQISPVCNIYDMGGNVYEETTEYRKEDSVMIMKGGAYIGQETFNATTIYKLGYTTPGGNNAGITQKEAGFVTLGFRIAMFFDN